VVYRDLKNKGFRLYPVNPNTDRIGDDACVPSVKDLKEEVNSLLVMTPPAQTDQVVREAFDKGIKNIWIQQGAESNEAVQFCMDNDMNVVHSECILMYTEPVGFPHSVHRFFMKLFGKMPR
jgi:predicted CoA-binding protein